MFASGQARGLEVQAEGQEPQPRVMLLSVPYALKAGDAQTLGGQARVGLCDGFQQRGSWRRNLLLSCWLSAPRASPRHCLLACNR